MKLRVQVLLVLWSVAVAGSYHAARAQELQQRHISVRAESSVEVPADLAYIDCGVISLSPDLDVGLSEVNQSVSNILQAAEALGVAAEDIEAYNLKIQPKYEKDFGIWRQMQGNAFDLIGHEVSRDLAVTIRDLSKLGDAIEALIAAGANRFGDIRLNASNAQELKNRALDEAIRVATARATHIAAGFGVRLGPLYSVDASGSSWSDQGHTTMYRASYEGFLRNSYAPGMLRIEADIKAVFTLE